ncbi:hypothetical protein ACVB8X_13235 [Streptomyces sp. NRAIS4]
MDRGRGGAVGDRLSSEPPRREKTVRAHLRDTELPELCDELELAEQERAGLAGFLHWSLSAGRYTDFRARTAAAARLLRGPVGLGTAVARLPLSR